VVSATIEFCERVLKHFIAEGKPETAVVLDRTENDAVAARPDRATQCAVTPESFTEVLLEYGVTRFCG
jgi:hypothetical protein